MSCSSMFAQKPVISSFPVDENTCSMTVNAKTVTIPLKTPPSPYKGSYRPAKAGGGKIAAGTFSINIESCLVASGSWLPGPGGKQTSSNNRPSERHEGWALSAATLRLDPGPEESCVRARFHPVASSSVFYSRGQKSMAKDARRQDGREKNKEAFCREIFCW